MGDLRNTIYRALCEYRMSNMCFEGEDCDPFTLYDLATPEGKTIDAGKAELFKVADFISGEINAKETNQ